MLLAEEQHATASAEAEARQLFDEAFGPAEGQRRYEEWQRTKAMPLDAYLAHTDAALATSSPSTTETAAPPTTSRPTTSTPSEITSPPLTAAATAVAAPAAAPPPGSSPVTDYYLTQGDILKIAVWQWPDLREDEVIIRPDGKFSFPLVGDVMARGLTVSQLNAVLTERLKRYIRDPQVLVAIRRFGGYKAIVLGEVKNPGVYLLGEATNAPVGGGGTVGSQSTLLEVVSRAGGFTPAAKLRNVVILRGPRDHPDIKLVDVYRTMYGRTMDLRANIAILPNDIIFVPRTVMTDVKEVFNTVVPAVNAIFQTIIGYDQVEHLRLKGPSW